MPEITDEDIQRWVDGLARRNSRTSGRLLGLCIAAVSGFIVGLIAAVPLLAMLPRIGG